FYLTNGKKIIVGNTLMEYDELLSDHNFFRTHKSHLINLEFMTKYVKGIGGYVIMSDGSEVEVAKRRKESFMERLSHV
ncbi:MAG: LytTR family transcriptional regulator, partial [Bacteroidetes bacterium]|nr:LytTR family transcriptional regulator [Bacteroidota bacterium]